MEKGFELSGNDLKLVADEALIGWGEELLMQGHKLSGRLIKSLGYEVRKKQGVFSIEFFVENYGLILDRGVKRERIPFSIPGRAKRSLFIEALIKYVKRRMRIGGERGKRVAFAIARVQKYKDGMPTRGSYRFSKNGRRLGWIEEGFDRKAAELEKLLDKIIGKKIEVLIEGVFSEGVEKLG